MTFRGNFPAKLDQQGRIKIPSAHRKVFEEHYGPEVYVTSFTGKSVLIYPMSEWVKLEARLSQAPKFSKSRQILERNAMYFGQTSSLDKQGRVGIQPLLREAAGIEGDLAIMGSLEKLEIWDHDKIRNQLVAEPLGDAELAELTDLGI